MIHTHQEYLEFVGEQIAGHEGRIRIHEVSIRELSMSIQYEEDENISATIIHLDNLIRIDKLALSAWLAIHEVLVRHEPEIRYALDEGDGSFDSEQELLDSFTEQELKESPPEITTFIICSACGELNTEIQENADEWVYLPEVYFPCPTYLDITKHLDTVMEQG